MIWDQVVERWLAAGENYRRDTGYALRDLPCTYCGDPAQTLDHVVPRASGGPDTPENLVPACRVCNGSKSAKTLEAWAAQIEADLARVNRKRRQLAAIRELLSPVAVFVPTISDEVNAELDAALARVPDRAA